MRVLSLYDGISCGMAALERSGISVERYDAFEIDKYAIKISEKNYPQIVHHGDVFDGDFTQFKGYDLLIGGSPCTYWSIAKNGRKQHLTEWAESCLWNMSELCVKVGASISCMKTITASTKTSRRSFPHS